MPVITVEPDLYKQVKTVASEQQVSIDEVLAEAARDYLWELDRQKISRESEAYRQMHAALKKRFFGQYVAVHDGDVVDHDADESKLWQRIRQRFGHTPVMITQVGETPERTLVRRGFRFEE
jgi:hypothetical protein